MPTSNFRTSINRAEVANNIMKGFGQETDIIIKGGEGSKGGKIIGHTKSGKPIYDTNGFNHKHKEFYSEDHLDAAKKHEKLRAKHYTTWVDKEGRHPRSKNKDLYERHKQFQEEHEKLAKEKAKKD